MKWILIVVGALLIIVGSVWALQGANVLLYGQMAGHGIWTVVGGGLGVIGIVLVVLGSKSGRSRSP